MAKAPPKKAKGISIHTKSFLIATAIFLTYLLIISLNSLVKNVVGYTTNTKKYITTMEHFFGRDKSSTTLVLFTNNSEMRYGGGFIGSVGLIRAQNSKVEVDPIRSVYYFDHRLDGKEALDKMPPEFKNIAEDMRLRDSGIYLNWDRDAQNALKYYEMETGVKPDNVVAITPIFLREILKKTGPIELKDYGLTVTSENFLQTVQLEVESGDDKKAGSDPKTILGVLGNEVLSRLSKQDIKSLAGYADVITPMIEQKQMMAYASDLEVQKNLRTIGVSGELSKFDGNYVMLAEENVGGNKSSPFIGQTVDQILTIGENGEAIVDLKLTRQHTSDFMHKYIDPHGNKERWLVGENTNYAKLALPAGSKLVSPASALGEVVEGRESGRTTYGFWFTTLPKETKTINLRYKLPYKYKMDQQLVVNSLFEKQTGGFEQKINQKVIVPNSYRLKAASNADVVYNKASANEAELTTSTNKNLFTSFVYGR